MIKYKYRTQCIPAKYISCKDAWFESMHEDGWELVSIDYTRISIHGMTNVDNQFYIFRKAVEDNKTEKTI